MTELIDKAFADLIGKRGIHKSLGVKSFHIRGLRYRLSRNLPISMDMKLSLLKKSGFYFDLKTYSRKELLSLVNFVLHSSAAARELGEDYLVEKWERSKS